jgi:hypothetical protein
MSASWRTGDLAVLVVAAVGTIVLTIASYFAAPPDTMPRNDGSSFGTHAEGAGAAFVLLKESGYTVERSFEPLVSFKHSPESTTLVLANPMQRPSDLDVRALKSFVERGGHVLATGEQAATFLEGIPNRTSTRAARARRQRPTLPSPLSAGVKEINSPVGSAPLPEFSRFVPVFGSPAEIGVAVARFGKGQAVWWAGSRPLTNRGIGEPNHVELFVNSLGIAHGRTIVWDEFYHGHARSFWSYVSGTPLPAAILQIAGITALALFTFSRRRRPIRSTVVEPRTSPLEFIDTMGGLYERARAANAAVAVVRERVRRRLLELAGLPVTTSDEHLVAAASERLSLDVDLAAILARSAQASIDPDVTAAQAVSIVAELQTLAVRARASERQRQRHV